MSFVNLKTTIKNKLESISKLQDVKTDPISDFNGYPACYFVPSDNENDYSTNVENIRVYTFTLRLFYEVTEGEIATAYDAMGDLVDTVIDAFDSDEQLSGLSLPSGYILSGLLPMPSLWVYLEQEKLLMAELKISARISVDVS